MEDNQLQTTVLKPGAGNSNMKRTGVLVVSLRSYKSGFGTSRSVQPQPVHSGSFAVLCRVLSQKI